MLIVDNETPEADLEKHLRRFSAGLELDYRKLPIKVMSHTGFIFDRKVELRKVLTVVQEYKPVYIRLDSLVAMLPLGIKGINENSSQLGGMIEKLALEKYNEEEVSEKDLSKVKRIVKRWG